MRRRSPQTRRQLSKVQIEIRIKFEVKITFINNIHLLCNRYICIYGVSFKYVLLSLHDVIGNTFDWTTAINSYDSQPKVKLCVHNKHRRFKDTTVKLELIFFYNPGLWIRSPTITIIYTN